MKRKVRKYVEGGFGDDDYERNENREGRMSTLDPSDIEDAIRGRQMAGTLGKVEYPNRMREAAEAAGTAGEDTGVGLLAGTNSAKPPSKPPVRTKPPVKTNKPGTSSVKPPDKAPEAAPMGRTAMGKTAEQEMAALEAGRKAAGRADLERRMAYDKPLERVNPEASLIGGPALRGLRAAGAGLASKMAPQAAKPRVEPRIPQEAAKAAPKKPEADFYYGAKSPKMAEKPGAMTTKPPRGGEVAKGSEPKGGALATKSGQLARRGKDAEQLESPKRRLPYEKDMGPVEYAAAKNKRRLLDRDRRSDDVIESRKSGGKVGSASKRGDGIAMRGKTRGKYI